MDNNDAHEVPLQIITYKRGISTTFEIILWIWWHDKRYFFTNFIWGDQVLWVCVKKQTCSTIEGVSLLTGIAAWWSGAHQANLTCYLFGNTTITDVVREAAVLWSPISLKRFNHPDTSPLLLMRPLTFCHQIFRLRIQNLHSKANIKVAAAKLIEVSLGTDWGINYDWSSHWGSCSYQALRTSVFSNLLRCTPQY